MEKNKKKIAIVLCSVLICVAVISALVIVVINDRKKSATAETIMTCSVNPSIQIVLNKKDKVIDVKATNSDGDMILLNADFEGLTAEEAAEKFITLCTEAGYIDVNSTTGTKVSINLAGTKENYDEMKNAVVSKVNSYFDENGIIAGAVANVNDDIKTALENVYADTEDLANKTKEELLELYSAHVEAIKGVAYNQQETLEKEYDALKKVFESATELGSLALAGVKATITTVEATVKLQSQELATKLAPLFEIAKATNYEELQTSLENAKAAVNEAEISSEMKTKIEEIINSTQVVLEEMKSSYETAKAEFEANYKQKIQDAINASNQYLEGIKAEVEAKIAEGKQALESRKAYYEANKEAVNQAIIAYRETLNNANV